MSTSSLRACNVGAVLATVALLAGSTPHRLWAASVRPNFDDLIRSEGARDNHAPRDYGFGPGVAPPSVAPNAVAPNLGTIGVPPSAPNAGTAGAFGPAVTWPIIGLHVALLPDGRVMNYGTDANGNQGAQFIYDVWTPSLGTGSGSHLVLPNTTSTDIFCSAQSVMWGSGQVLISGGDRTINGVRNYSINKVTIFSPQANTLSPAAKMHYARWYPAMIAQPDGEMLVLGGRLAPDSPTITPEIYNPQTASWRALPGAASSAAFGTNDDNWYYPRGFLAPGGKVFLISSDGTMWLLTTGGRGTISEVNPSAPYGSAALPAVMFAPGKILSVREQSQVVVIDLNGRAPVVTPTSNIDQERLLSNATVMADGRVLVNGGSAVWNDLTGASYQATIWDPATELWTPAATATKPRLYHSVALLLPDATVLTGAGGAPGPVSNLNAEIYYPPYLYLSDGSGQPAARPSLLASPTVAPIGQPFQATVGPTDQISRVTFVRTGSSTHSTNPDQRFLQLPFVQNGPAITATLPSDPTIVLPGNYMLFMFNQAGVPSISNIVLVPSP